MAAKLDPNCLFWSFPMVKGGRSYSFRPVKGILQHATFRLGGRWDSINACNQQFYSVWRDKVILGARGGGAFSSHTGFGLATCVRAIVTPTTDVASLADTPTLGQPEERSN